MSAPKGGTAFVKNPGTSQESVVSQVAVSFPDLRLRGDSSLPEVIRQVNLLEVATAQATLSARSLPFGGPCSYLVGFQFTNATKVRLAHRLMTDRVRLWLGHKDTAGGDVAVTAVDSNFVTVLPNATFVADVMFLTIP